MLLSPHHRVAPRRDYLVPVFLPQSRRQSQNPLRPLELIEPILSDADQKRIARTRNPAGARFAGLLFEHIPVSAQRSLPVTGDFIPVFAEKDSDGDAVAAVDLQLALDIRVVVAIEIADVEERARFREACEDRALADAIAAPCSGEN